MPRSSYYQAHREACLRDQRAYAKRHPDRIQAYLEATRPKRLAKKRAYRLAHIDTVRRYARINGSAYYYKNREARLRYATEYRRKNADLVRKNQKAYRDKNKARAYTNHKSWRGRNLEHVREYRLAYYAKNKKALNKKAAKYYAENKEAILQQMRANPKDSWPATYKSRYRGFTLADRDALIDAQGNRCAVCRDPLGSRPHTDHCHKRGHVRGIICGHCNRGLGFFLDSPKRLRAAIDYLKRTNTAARRPRRKISQ